MATGVAAAGRGRGGAQRAGAIASPQPGAGERDQRAAPLAGVAGVASRRRRIDAGAEQGLGVVEPALVEREVGAALLGEPGLAERGEPVVGGAVAAAAEQRLGGCDRGDRRAERLRDVREHRGAVAHRVLEPAAGESGEHEVAADDEQLGVVLGGAPRLLQRDLPAAGIHRGRDQVDLGSRIAGPAREQLLVGHDRVGVLADRAEVVAEQRQALAVRQPVGAPPGALQLGDRARAVG